MRGSELCNVPMMERVLLLTVYITLSNQLKNDDEESTCLVSSSSSP